MNRFELIRQEKEIGDLPEDVAEEMMKDAIEDKKEEIEEVKDQ